MFNIYNIFDIFVNEDEIFCRKCNISSFFFPTKSGLFPLLTLNIYKKLPQKQNFDRGKIFTRHISVQFSRLNIVIFRPQGKKLFFSIPRLYFGILIRSSFLLSNKVELLLVKYSPKILIRTVIIEVFDELH